MSVSEFSDQDRQMIADAYADLREAAQKRCANQKELDVVQKAFDFANAAHNGVRRRSGEPYMLHPIAVAKIVVSGIGLGYKSIAAALLHDVVEDTDYTVEDVRNLFGDKIASLVDGLTKIKTVLDKEDQAKTQSMQAENFKRILLTLNDDVRVVLIKLADRLHNCRTIEFMPEYKRDKILSETMFIFIPLAHRLGLYSIKSEMEDIWLKYKEPEAFKEISERINTDYSLKERELNDFIIPIRESLEKAGFSFRISERVKKPYSIWHKIQTKGVTYDQIYDLYAVRIVFDPEKSCEGAGRVEDERAQCYHIFSLITSIYKYKADRVRDWVESPKNNGYEALHCTVMSNTGTWVEIQIRSERMDAIAEKGIAAHWAYKKNGMTQDGTENEMELWINKIKSILVNPDVTSLELLDLIHNDLTTTDIFVFTPKGDQKRIQKGATALDFAYLIHTHIGNQAIAAKVNMRLVSLSHVLHTGDQVEIITAGDGIPKREWLNFLITNKARSVVSSYFRDKDASVESLNQDFRPKPTDNQKSTWNLLGLLKKADKKAHFLINAETIGRCEFCRTCHPIPGDSVVGIISEDKVFIHKKTCPEANSLAAKFGDKIVIPEWSLTKDNAFDVRLELGGIDRIGIVNEISRYVSLVLSMNTREFTLKADEGVFEGHIILSVHDTDELDKLIKRLSRIQGLNKVVRKDL
ncbi:MAG: HD domain-containing protein [Bacteroidales bacterium]|nr:HD domain-containing protein [Bacteroidales bacterium]